MIIPKLKLSGESCLQWDSTSGHSLSNESTVILKEEKMRFGWNDQEQGSILGRDFAIFHEAMPLARQSLGKQGKLQAHVRFEN